MDTLHGLDALFVTDPVNIRYLTGFAGVEPSAREAYVLVTHDKTYLFTTGLYLEHAAALTAKPEIVALTPRVSVAEALRERTQSLHVKKLGIEEHNLTVAELDRFKTALPGVSFVSAGMRIERLRMIKTAEELASLRLAASITDQCFKFILQRIRPGTTEGKLAWEIESYCRARAGGQAFSPIVAFNEHSSMPHYMQRGNNPLRNRSLILLDFGAAVNGYCADMTRVVFLGTPEAAWATAYDVVLAAHDKAIGMLKDGVRNGATLDAAAKEVIAEADLPPYSHSLGHAVGLEIHESPRLSAQHEATLEPGMAVTVEPGTYVAGRYGIRIEDLVLIKKTGLDMLSKSPKSMTVL